MDEKTKDTESKEEVKQPTETKYSYKKHHQKPMVLIAKEEAEERKKLRVEAEKLKAELEQEAPTEPETPKQEVNEEPKQVEKQPEAPKVDEEALKKELDQQKKDVAELKKIAESTKLSQEQKEVKQEELKAKWAKEGRTPQDYDEIWEEASNAGFEKAKAWFKEQEEAKARETAAQEKARIDQEERVKAENEAKYKSIEASVNEEIERMFQNKIIERPRDFNDTNDPQVIRYRAIFQKGQQVNAERLAAGKEPIRSIADIYYNYYLPSEKAASKQPAGANAPIQGSRSVPTPPPSNDDRYSYVKDHGKSIRQIGEELLKKITK